MIRFHFVVANAGSNFKRDQRFLPDDEGHYRTR